MCTINLWHFLHNFYKVPLTCFHTKPSRPKPSQIILIEYILRILSVQMKKVHSFHIFNSLAVCIIDNQMLGSSVVNEREWKMRLRKIKTNKNQKKIIRSESTLVVKVNLPRANCQCVFACLIILGWSLEQQPIKLPERPPYTYL